MGSNISSSASSVYQPGLLWPPRILTVNFQVTRGPDGHSGIRRPVWSSYKRPPGEKLCQIHRDQRGFILDFVYLRVCFGVVFFLNLHIFKLFQNLTISLACGQVCTVHLLLHFWLTYKPVATATAILNPSSFIWPEDVTGGVGDDLRALRSRVIWAVAYDVGETVLMSAAFPWQTAVLSTHLSSLIFQQGAQAKNKVTVFIQRQLQRLLMWLSYRWYYNCLV